MKRLFLFAIVTGFVTFSTQAQKMKAISGSPEVIKGDKNVNVIFTYENLKVGKKLEADYIEKRKSDKNKKEAGTGDKWEKAWHQDKIDRYPPKFIKLFNIHGGELFGTKLEKDATGSKYTMRVNTSMIEPGFNVGVSRRPALINMEIYIYKTGNSDDILYKQTIIKSTGTSGVGSDFDAGERIKEGFAKAGKSCAKFMYKKFLK